MSLACRARITMKRNRLYYAIIMGIVIVAGCASRSALADPWPEFLSTYAGDTLWALMVFLGLGLVLPTTGTWLIAMIVLAFAFSVEVSQLYHAPWIDSFRNTFVGAVTIGSGFLWSDFLCYTMGCAMGVIVEMLGAGLAQKAAKG